MLFIVGHGKSDGDRVHIEDFQIYVRDVIQHIEMLKAEYGNIPFFLLGHSMVSEPNQELIIVIIDSWVNYI